MIWPKNSSHGEKSFLVPLRPCCNAEKTIHTGNHNIVVPTAGAMYYEQVAVVITPADDPDMTNIGCKHKVARECFTLGYNIAVIQLCLSSAVTAARIILSVRRVVKCPVYKAGAVKPLRPVCAGRLASH